MLKSTNYSAVLTTFNAETTITRALQSILEQSIKPDEIIIVDDASADQTLKIISKISANNEKIKIICSESNLGPANSRNLGVRYCKNEFIIFFDDDDESQNLRAESQINRLIGSDLNYVSSRKIYSTDYKINFLNNNFIGLVSPLDLIEYLLMGKNNSEFNFSIPASTLAIRRSAFNLIGGFDTGLRRLEDVDLAIRAADVGLKFSFSNDVLVNRFHSIGVDKGSSTESDSQIYILNKYKSRLNSRKYNQIKNWYFVRRYYFNKNYFKLFWKLGFYILRYGFSKKMFEVGFNRLKHDKSIKSS
jgi:glycosyltransferase involved in cell wall biosynthesis